jgi:hypothetical protein
MTLHEYLDECREKPFAWGRHDCALFAAQWVKLATGKSLTMGIRYRSERAGRKALAGAGYDAPVDVAAAHLQEVHPAFARPGDVALIGDAMGIVAGERVAVLRPEGLGWVPLTDATRAFRVM